MPHPIDHARAAEPQAGALRDARWWRGALAVVCACLLAAAAACSTSEARDEGRRPTDGEATAETTPADSETSTTATADDTATAEASDAPPVTELDPDGRLVDIGGGREMYIECTGEGAPTVVLVPGQRASGNEWQTTQSALSPPAPPVFDTIAETNRVCTYDRPGVTFGDTVSRSDPGPQPTTAEAGASDLYLTLDAADEEGPFVLVGHSAGGMITRVFATTHPDQVLAMVLVDPPSEHLQNHFTDEEWVWAEKMFKGDMTESIEMYPALERFDPTRSYTELRESPALEPMPMVLLNADEKLGPTFQAFLESSGDYLADVPATFGYRFDEVANEARADLAAMVPGTVHITNTHSGHNIHMIQPQIVTNAIRYVLARLALEAAPA